MNRIGKISVMMLALLLLARLPHAQTACALVPSPIAAQISTNEPWYCPINQQIYGQWASALPAAMVVVLISFLISAAIFMAGVAFNSNRIRNFGIGEFYEALATAIIIGAFLYVCAIGFGLLPATAVGNINPYATAFNLMTTTITSAQNMYSSVFNVYLSMSFATSPTVDLNVAGAGTISKVSQTVLNVLGVAPQLFINIYSIPITLFFLDPAQAIAGFLVDGLGILYAEYYILVFFSTAAIPAFLVPGVFFRSIFPTRALGGLMIALAVGFYLIMPTLFAVVYYFTAPTVQSSMQLAASQLSRFGTGAASTSLSPSNPLVLQLQGVKASLNGFWLLILFYPALIIVITYTSVQEIANFIGAASARMGAFRRFL